jgi:predicted secreted protein
MTEFKHAAARAAHRALCGGVSGLLLLLLVLLPAAGCAGDSAEGPAGESTPPPRQPPQGVVTEADSGGTFEVPLGGETSLRLSSDYVWSEPAAEGGAVELAPVDYLQDPGYSEWMVRGVQAGTASISALGEPACAGEGCPDEPLPFRVTITITS